MVEAQEEAAQRTMTARAAADARARAEVIEIEATEALIRQAADHVAYEPARARLELEQARQRLAGEDLPQWLAKLTEVETALRQADAPEARAAAERAANATLDELTQARLAANAARSYELAVLIGHLELVIAKHKQP